MKDLIIFALHVLGVIYVVTQSTIMSLPRMVFRRLVGETLAKLVYCAACFGFWLGAALHLLRLDAGMTLAQSAFSACALGALWSEYGSTLSPWQTEAPQNDKTEKTTHG